MQRTQSHKKKFPRGLSLVELILVLGISSLLAAGAFGWFSNRRSVDFYNQARQIEAFFKEIQSEAASNIVPGFTGNAACNVYPRTSACPIGNNEEVLGTAISIMRTPGINSPVSFTVHYLKSYGPTDTPAPRTNRRVAVYNNSQTLNLPEGIKYTGYKRYPGGDAPCTTSGLDYSNLTRDNADGRGGVLQAGPNTVAMTVFRKQPSSTYIFQSRTFPGAAVALPTVVNDINPGAMINYGYDNPSLGTLRSRPCALSLLFESEERISGLPRFTAELNINLVNNTIRLRSR